METFADIAAKLINEYYGYDYAVARKRYIDTSGIPFFQQIEIIVPGGKKNKACADEFEETKLKPFFDESFTADVNDTLKKLKLAGFNLCISSGNFQHLLEEFIKRENLDFDVILGFHEGLSKGKEHFEYIKKQLSVKKENMLFVGDSLKDGEKAFDYGIKFIGRSGIFSRKDFEKNFNNIKIVDKISTVYNILIKAKELKSI
jgi:HAD superfamily hydrolase (TIGR01549 family)